MDPRRAALPPCARSELHDDNRLAVSVEQEQVPTRFPTGRRQTLPGQLHAREQLFRTVQDALRIVAAEVFRSRQSPGTGDDAEQDEPRGAVPPTPLQGSPADPARDHDGKQEQGNQFEPRVLMIDPPADPSAVVM